MAENKFYTRWWFFVIIGVIILGSIVGFSSNSLIPSTNVNTGNTQETQDSPTNIKPVKIEDLSTLILKVEDFPQDEGWTLKDRAERGKTDVSDNGLNLGWKRGYYANYLNGELKAENLDYSRVDLLISEYPPENISLALKTEESDDYTTYDPLSDPQIGDESKAYKVISINEYDVEDIYYEIQFRKKNLLFTLQNYGTRTDYALLKDLAKKAEAKI